MEKYDEIRNKLNNSFFPAVPVTFDKNGHINVGAQEKYAKYMDTQPITGISIWVHTGRGLLLTKEQRENVYKTWREALSRDKMIICGVGSKLTEGMTEEEFISNSLDMAQHAKKLGADLILVYPPAFYIGKPDQDKKVIEYHKRMDELGIPIILFYLYEEAGGILYSKEILEKLFTIDNVISIKMATLDSITTYQNVSNLVLKDFPKIKILTGEDRMFGYSFARGASGAIVGLGAVCQKLQKEMMEAYYKKDYDIYVKRMLEVDKLAECTFIHPIEGYIQKMLYILYLQGIIPEDAVNDPYGPGLKENEKNEIKKVLIELGFITKEYLCLDWE